MTEDRLPLPGTPDEITPEWLESALSGEHPGVRVTSVHLGEILWGTATKVRLLVGYGPSGHAAGLPATLVVKAGFGGHELAADMISFYESEVRFYRDLAPSLDIGLPHCYFAGMDRALGRAVVVLEDLCARNAVFAPPAEPMPLDLVARGLALQARWHAATWNRPEPAKLGTYPGDLRAVLTQVLGGEYWERCLAKPRARALPAELREPGALRATIEALWAVDDAESMCLIHGDAHCGNAYVHADGSPGFVDWQMAGRGHWAHDVAYWVIMALEPADRREHERALLAGYLDALAAEGVTVKNDLAAWNAYRRHAVHGLFWAANADGMYPEETNTRVVERFAAAVSDLDACALLTKTS